MLPKLLHGGPYFDAPQLKQLKGKVCDTMGAWHNHHLARADLNFAVALTVHGAQYPPFCFPSLLLKVNDELSRNLLIESAMITSVPSSIR